jgi:hypothetical protein
MAHSGRQRHRDRAETIRRFDDSPEVPARNRVFRMTGVEREQIAKCLRYFDEARRALESQQHAGNREIVRELRASADKIYDVINELEETGDEPEM